MNPRISFALVMLLLPLLAPPIANAAEANALPRYQRYAEIPGVTREEIDAVERLKRIRPEGLSYAMLYSDTSFINDDGEVGGFTRLICREIGGLFGMTVTPRLVEWNALVNGLDNHEFDLSGELTATPQRREKYRMTTPITERGFIVFHRADRDDLDLINGKEELRYGFLEGSVTYTRVLEASELPFTAVFVGSTREAAEAIRNGSVDAFITEGRMESLFENYPGIAYQEYYPLLYTSVSLTTANPDVFPIIDVFQKYLDNGGRERISELIIEGEREYLRHKFRRQLSDEEKRYVEDHVHGGKAIPIAAEHDNYPASFYNRQEQRWQGITHDVLAEITRLTDLKFEIVNSSDATWLEVMEMLERGDAAMVTELMPTKSRRGRFLWPELPYMMDSYALLSKADTPNLTMHQVFHSRVGMIRGSAHEEAFHQVFPDHANYVAFGNAMECFEALENEKVDLVMMTKNLLLGITNYSERPGFKINIPLKLPSNSYFGFHRGQSVLCGIIDKAQKIVPTAHIADQWERKGFDYGKKLAQARIPYLISIFALVLLVLTLLLALSRKKEFVSRRLSMIDHLTRLPNRRHFEELVGSEWEKAMRDRQCLSLLAIDIDHFKLCNDTYGHPQGDEVLRVVASVLECSTQRHADLVARMGGEEFSVLLPNTEPEGARLVAERLREDIEHARIDSLAGGPPIHITVSIGVAGIRPGPDDSIKELAARSDQALYAAKQGGRNRVCLA